MTIRHTNGHLEKYYEDCRSGVHVIGAELMMELEKLMDDMEDDRYIYDTTDADRRIGFIEGCLKLTKSPFYGQPMVLMDFQKAYISALYGFYMPDGTQRFQRSLFLLARKNGKEISLDTPIETPAGRRIFKDIHPGDMVFSSDGKPTEVLWESEIRSPVSYEVEFEDGEIIIAGAEHNWTVTNKSWRGLAKRDRCSSRKCPTVDKLDDRYCMVKTTQELYDHGIYHERKDGKGREYYWRVPMLTAPVEYEPREPLFNPYWLGLWLGNGNSHQARITFNRDDEHIAHEYFEDSISTIYYPKQHAVEIAFAPFSKELKRLDLFKNKHIPEEYFYGSVQERIDLLKGLMDSDGTVGRNGQCAITQKNKVLADGIGRLLSSLGIKWGMREDEAKIYDKSYGMVYEITFFVDKAHTVFNLDRKTNRLKDHLSDRMLFKTIVDIRPCESVPMKCIAVDNSRGEFLCGERNTVTHNSELCSALLLTDMIIGGKGLDIVCASNNDEQAEILYRACDTMRVMIDPKNKLTWRNQKGIRCLLNDNKIFKMSDRQKTKEGRNIDLAVVDELHEQREPVIIKSIEQSQSLKVNPKLILISTEGFIRQGSLDQELTRARAILRDEIDDLASERYLPWLYTCDSEMDVWEGNRVNRLWEKANPTLSGGIKKYSYLEQQVDLARQNATDRTFVLCKDFNLPQNTSEAWLMPEEYSYESTLDIESFRGAICLGAVDIAETTDLSCARVFLKRPNDSSMYVYSMYFIPEGKLERADDKGAGAKYTEWAENGMVKICPGNYMDPSIIADWFASLYRDYGLRPYLVGYDQRFAAEFLSRMEAYGFTTELIYQSSEVLNTPIRMVEADLKSQRIMGLNEVDRWCLSNCSLKMNSRGEALIVKAGGSPSKKIDGAVTLAIGYEVYRRHRTEFETAVAND